MIQARTVVLYTLKTHVTLPGSLETRDQRLLSLAYYATWSIFRVMGENGAVPPLLAAYAPDLIAVFAGLVLLRMAGRR